MLELDSRGNRLSLQSSEGYKERMDRSPEGAHDDEVTWLMYAAIGIAVCTVIVMYGWMGYTLYAGYLEDKVRISFSTISGPPSLHLLIYNFF